MRTASMGVTALDLAVFVSGSFVAALASQVAGFAYGLVAAAVWLQLLAPMQTVTLIIAFGPVVQGIVGWRSEEHTSELQSHLNLVCRLLLEKKKHENITHNVGRNRHAQHAQHIHRTS